MEISPEAAAVFAGLIALANAVVRICERLIDGALKKKGGDEVLSYDTAVMQARQVDELWAWHNHDMPDQPGVKVWWSTAMKTSLVDLQTSIDRLSDRLEDD